LLATPNGWKAQLLFEELGIDVKVVKLSIGKLEQKQDWFLKINPNGRIPAIVDHSNGDFNVFESGAILMYVCEKYAPQSSLLPQDDKLRSEVIQWVSTLFETRNRER
jgi:glutathione S-transferase